MATGKIIGRIEVASIGSVKIIGVDGTVRDAVYNGLMYEGEQLVSSDPSTLFQIKYLALPEPTAYEGVFGVLADGSVTDNVSELEALFGNDIDFMETAGGGEEAEAHSGIPEDSGIVAESSVESFNRGENGSVGLGITTSGVGTSAQDQTPPVIKSSNVVIFDENDTNPVIQVQADDTSNISFSLNGGLDSDLFNLDAKTGILTFKSPPNYETPLDTGADNVYNVEVTVTDAFGNYTTQFISVSVNNLNDNIPTAENATNNAIEDVYDDGSDHSATGTLAGSDADGNEIKFVLIDNTSEGHVTLDENGQYSFDVGGDFQNLAFGETKEVSFTYATKEVGPPLSEPSDAGPFESNPATVTITVTGTNDQPVVSNIDANGFTEDRVDVTFDNLTPYTVPDGYDGVNWDSHLMVLNGVDYTNQNGGYDNGVTSGENVAYNAWGASPTVFLFDEPVSFNSTNLTSAWATTQNVVFQGYLNGELVYTSDVIEINNESSTAINLDWSDIDKLVLTNTVTGPFEGGGGGANWAMDDFTYTVNAETIVLETTSSGDPLVDTNSSDVYTTFDGNLATATDPDTNDTHTYHLVDDSVKVDNIPAQIGVVVDADGDYHISGDFNHLAAGETAQVTFQYYADDGQGFGTTGDGGANEASLSVPKTVTLTITGTNDAPVAVADTGLTTENIAVTIDVLANDTDVDDGAVLTLNSVSVDDGNGSVSVVGNELLFNPGSDFDHLAVGETTNVNVAYTMSDEYGATSSATATITVTGTNDQPVVSDINANVTDTSFWNLVSEGANLQTIETLSGSDVNNNGSDPTDGSAVKFTVATDAGETVSFNWNFTDAEGDSSLFNDFSFVVVDGVLSTLEDSMDTDVNGNSIFSHVFTTAGEHTITFGVMNSTDDIMNSELNVEHNSGGTVIDMQHVGDVSESVLNAESIVYETTSSGDPSVDTNSSDIYTTFDGNLATANDPDTNDTHTYHLVDDSVKVDNIPAQIGVVVDADGDYHISGDFNHLAAGETAQVTFQYYADDGQGFGTTGDNGLNEASLSVPKTVTLTITGTNDAPVSVADIGDTTENATLTMDVLANDTDVDDGAVLTLNSVSVDDGNGSVSIVDNELVFNPGSDFDHLAAGETATVQVAYTISDEHDATSSSIATITVTGTNDAPVLSTGSFDINETITGEVVVGQVSATDVDDGAVLSYSLANDYGLFDITDNGTIMLKDGASLDYENTPAYSLDVKVTDEHGASDVQTVDVDVNNITGVVTNSEETLVSQDFSHGHNDGWTSNDWGSFDTRWSELGRFHNGNTVHNEFNLGEDHANQEVRVEFDLNLHQPDAFWHANNWESNDAVHITANDVTHTQYGTSGDGTYHISMQVVADDDGKVDMSLVSDVDRWSEVWSLDNFEIQSSNQVISFDNSSDGTINVEELITQSNDFDLNHDGRVDSGTPNSVDEINLSTGNHTLSNITLSDVLNITDSDNVLKITGNTGDEVHDIANNGWVIDTTPNVTESGYDTYTNVADTNVQLLIDVDIPVDSD